MDGVRIFFFENPHFDVPDISELVQMKNQDIANGTIKKKGGQEGLKSTPEHQPGEKKIELFGPEHWLDL